MPTIGTEGNYEREKKTEICATHTFPREWRVARQSNSTEYAYTYARTLQPATLDFVPFGSVLVRVRVQLLAGVVSRP